MCLICLWNINCIAIKLSTARMIYVRQQQQEQHQPIEGLQRKEKFAHFYCTV